MRPTTSEPSDEIRGAEVTRCCSRTACTNGNTPGVGDFPQGERESVKTVANPHGRRRSCASQRVEVALRRRRRRDRVKPPATAGARAARRHRGEGRRDVACRRGPLATPGSRSTAAAGTRRASGTGAPRAGIARERLGPRASSVEGPDSRVVVPPTGQRAPAPGAGALRRPAALHVWRGGRHRARGALELCGHCITMPAPSGDRAASPAGKSGRRA